MLTVEIVADLFYCYFADYLGENDKAKLSFGKLIDKFLNTLCLPELRNNDDQKNILNSTPKSITS